MQSTADPTAIVWYGHGLATWLQRLAAHLIDLLLLGGCLVTAIFGLAMTLAADSREFMRESDKAWIAEWLSEDLGRGS